MRARRRVRAAGGAVAVASLAVGAIGAGVPLSRAPLDSVGVVATPAGPRAVAPGESVRFVPGTTVTVEDARSPRGAALAGGQRAWLAAGRVPGPAALADLATRALLDLHTLTGDSGAVLAGPSGPWRYVWPRDASFAAAALAATGHDDDAARVLGFLARVQEDDGTFQARYLPDGSGVPDARGVQLDGCGWVLWATARWYDATPDGPARDARYRELAPMVRGALAAIDARTDPRSGLPEPSSDYWEAGSSTRTLGTLAPLLLGVEAARGLPTAAPSAAALAERLSRGLDRFAPGFPRELSGQRVDAAVTFLLPPLRAVAPDAATVRAWERAQVRAARPAGGVAPGEGWPRDGVSWTPETALFALSAAGLGRDDEARARLEWIDAHRTALGAIPEKVLADGSAAAIAPLAWSDAIVLLALAELGG